MIEVEIRGFQSIEHLSIQIDGFTALVGRSNIGKSAVVRAIKCALTNSLGTSFVRHGDDCARILRKAKACKCQSTVRLQTEGFDLRWEKGDAINRYTFNGERYDKPGQGIPEFLLSHGFAPIKVGDEVGSIQVADQFFPIFLLNQSGPAIAEAISDVARLDRVSAATKLVEKDRREVVSTKKIREKDAEGLRLRLTAYEGLDTALTKATQAAVTLGGVEKALRRVNALSHYVVTTEDLVKRIKGLWEVGSILVPDVAPLAKGAVKVGVLVRFVSDLTRRVEGYKSIAWVEKFLDLIPAIEAFQEAAKKLQQLDLWIHRLRSYRARFAALEAAGAITLPAVVSLETKKDRLRDLARFTSRQMAIAKAIQQVQADLEGVSKEEGLVQGEVEALGVCPTCTQPVQTGHAHA
jgi:hypothetical protein